MPIFQLESGRDGPADGPIGLTVTGRGAHGDPQGPIVFTPDEFAARARMDVDPKIEACVRTGHGSGGARVGLVRVARVHRRHLAIVASFVECVNHLQIALEHIAKIAV